MFLASVCSIHAAPTAFRLTPDRRRPSPGPVGFPPSALALVLLCDIYAELQSILAVGFLLYAIKEQNVMISLPMKL